MTDRTLNTEIIYNNNCNYQKSKSTQQISVPLSKINLDITFTNISQPTSTDFYFNDIIKINIFAYQNETIPIGWGNVIFYFVDVDDISMTKQMINDNPIPIDKNGNASVEFIPHNSGTIYVKYFGDPYHTTENEYVFNNFILKTRPTHIEFEKYSPYLINPNETVTMNVSVTDVYDQTFIEYGLVTFMNYHEYTENRVEKIIGNPVYIIDGKASIKYSPIQLGTNELFHNIELIRASYNYDNEQYGMKWKYYNMHDDFTAIAIRRENQININIPQIKKSDNTYQALTVDNTGAFLATESNFIVCQCEITISENKVITDAIVNFVVQGISKTYNNNEVSETEITQVYPAYYRHTNTRDYFECLIENLPQGTYTVYATVKNPTTIINNDEEYTLPIIDSELTTPDVPIANNNLLIKDGIYLKSNKSESCYIKVESQSSILTLQLENKKTIITNKTIDQNDLILNIITENTDDLKFFNNEECWFYIPNLNMKYKGILSIDNGKLKATPQTNITINNIGNYDIYAYIEGKIYTYTENGTTLTRKITTTYSNVVEAKIRNQIDITLKLQTIQEMFPNNIKYIIEGKNLEDPVLVEIWIDNVKTDLTHTLSKVIKDTTGTIPLQKPGLHTIKAVVNSLDYPNVQAEKTFTVTKGEIDVELINNQPILTSTITDLFFNIKHKNQKELKNIETLNFDVQPSINQTSPIWNIPSEIKDGEIFVQNPKKITDKLYELHTNGCLYIAGDWQVNINCTNNDYYNTLNKTINFETINRTPICINIEKNTNSFINKVIYDQNIQRVSQIINDQEIVNDIVVYNTLPCKVLIISKLIKDENHSISFVHITDDQGNYTITKPQTISNTDWQLYKTIEYQIVPQHTILNSFKNLSSVNQAVSIFNSTFTNHQCSDADIKELYNNAKEYNFTTLFVGYDNATDTINLYEEEENGFE